MCCQKSETTRREVSHFPKTSPNCIRFWHAMVAPICDLAYVVGEIKTPLMVWEFCLRNTTDTLTIPIVCPIVFSEQITTLKHTTSPQIKNKQHLPKTTNKQTNKDSKAPTNQTTPLWKLPEINKSKNPRFGYLPRAGSPPDLPTRFSDAFLFLILLFVDLFEFCARSTSPGMYPSVLVFKFQSECIKHHVWRPLGARDMSLFVNAYIFAEIVRGYKHGRKEHQTLYRMVFLNCKMDERWFALWAYYDIMILWYCHIVTFEDYKVRMRCCCNVTLLSYYTTIILQ